MSIKSEKKNLRKRISNEKIPKSTSKNLRFLTWNIRNLNGKKEDKAIEYMVQIIKKFDLIAIQEVKNDLGGIEKLQKKLGKRYRFLFSDPSGNSERLAYCYDSKKVKFTGLAAEVVMAPGAGRDTVEPELEFDRQPYVASFRVSGCNFIVTNCHIFYGSGSQVEFRHRELKNIAKYLKKRSSSSDALDSDYIACGDFNIEKAKVNEEKNTKSKSKKRKILDSLFSAFRSHGLIVPEDIRNSPSNLSKTKHFDQIGFHKYKDSTLQYIRGGVIDFVGAVYVKDPKMKYKFTDHLPMYAVFSVSKDKKPKYINP